MSKRSRRSSSRYQDDDIILLEEDQPSTSQIISPRPRRSRRAESDQSNPNGTPSSSRYYRVLQNGSSKLMIKEWAVKSTELECPLCTESPSDALCFFLHLQEAHKISSMQDLNIWFECTVCEADIHRLSSYNRHLKVCPGADNLLLCNDNYAVAEEVKSFRDYEGDYIDDPLSDMVNGDCNGSGPSHSNGDITQEEIALTLELTRPRRSKRGDRNINDQSDHLPFRLPKWGGHKMINTCPLDNFLSILLAFKHRYPRFVTYIGDDPFSAAIKGFLFMSDEPDTAKIAFVHKIYEPNEEGDYDLYGEENSVVLERAETASTVVIKVECPSGRHPNHTIRRSCFFARVREVGEEVECWRDFFNEIITSVETCREREALDRPKCGLHLDITSIECDQSTWMIPIDISSGNFKPRNYAEFPNILTVGSCHFRLAGASLFGSGHFLAILQYDRDRVYHYNGLDPNLAECHHVDNIKIRGAYIKTVYYFRLEPLSL